MTIRYAAVALFVFCAGLNVVLPEQVPSVFVGRIEYVEPIDRDDLDLSNAMGAHGNTQFLVVAESRTLVGEAIDDRVIVGIGIDDRSMYGVEWWTAGFGVLDPSIWKRGSEVLVIYRPSETRRPICFPSSLTLSPGVPRPEGIEPGLKEMYLDEGLRKYHGLRVVCVTGGDVFMVRE